MKASSRNLWPIALTTAVICTLFMQIILPAVGHAGTQKTWMELTESDIITEPRTFDNYDWTCDEPEKGLIPGRSGVIEVDMCVSHGLGLSVAHYGYDDMYPSEWAVKPNGSDIYLPVFAWHQIDAVRAIEGTSKLVLITKRPYHDSAYEIHIADDALSALEPREGYYEIKQELMHSVFDAGMDDPKIFRKPILSKNGKYVIDDSSYGSLVRVNAITREVRYFGIGGSNIWPKAITKDGRYAFLWLGNMVPYAGVVDLHGCGHEQPQCSYKTYTFDRSLVADSFVTTSHQLSDDELEYRYYVSLPNGHPLKGEGALRVALRRVSVDQARGGRQIDYLAMGDSISSGEGDTEHRKSGGKYYRYPTDENGNKEKGIPKEKCHVSERSYPYRLAPAMDLGEINLSPDTVRWASVACSGATTGDIVLRDSGKYEGQKNGDTPRLQDFDVGKLKSEALTGFIPGRHKQMEFVKRHHPRAVTITVGANDIEFSRKLKLCVTRPGTCPSASDEGRKELAIEIQGLYDKLHTTYKEIYEKSGQSSKVFAIGYPRMIKDGKEVSGCPTGMKWINEEERLMINKATVYLNQVIRAAASSAGVYYLEGVQDSLIGHRICESDDSYVTPLSANIFGEDELQETFHPNAKGHEAISSALQKSLGGKTFAEFDVCPSTPYDGDVNCPNWDIKAPEPEREYFGDISTVKKVETRKMTPQSLIKQVLTQLSLPSGTFAQHTLVGGSVRSNPVSIGSFTADSSGGLDVNIAIPSTVPAGYHTLTLDGTGASGQPVRYVQVIEVQGSDSNDRDEDGIPDHIDDCPYIDMSHIDFDGDGIDDACDFDVSRKSTAEGNKTLDRQLAKVAMSPPALEDITLTGQGFDGNSKNVSGDNVMTESTLSTSSQRLPDGIAPESHQPTEGTIANESVPYRLIASILMGSIIATLAWRLYAK